MKHHTPEPWVVALKSGEKWATAYLIYTHDGNKHIAICNTYADVEGVANAARIVACVNGCTGLTEEQIKEAVNLWKSLQYGKLQVVDPAPGLNPAAYRSVVEALKKCIEVIYLDIWPPSPIPDNHEELVIKLADEAVEHAEKAITLALAEQP